MGTIRKKIGLCSSSNKLWKNPAEKRKKGLPVAGTSCGRTGWMRGALCVATRLYILYLAADESISGWEALAVAPTDCGRTKK